MTTNITGPAPALPYAHTPTLATVESGYQRLADQSFEPDALVAEFAPHPRMRRAEAEEFVQGQKFFTHSVNSKEHEPPKEMEALRRARYATRADAEAALDKLDYLISYYGPHQAKAFIEHVQMFEENASQRMRGIRISVTMGMNLTDVEGIAPDAADKLVATRLKEAVKDKYANIAVETRVIPSDDNKTVIIMWEAFDGPTSNATLHRHSEL